MSKFRARIELEDGLRFVEPAEGIPIHGSDIRLQSDPPEERVKVICACNDSGVRQVTLRFQHNDNEGADSSVIVNAGGRLGGSSRIRGMMITPGKRGVMRVSGATIRYHHQSTRAMQRQFEQEVKVKTLS